MISDASVLSPESGNGLKTPGKVTKFHDRKKARRRSNIILYTILSLVAVLMVLPTLVMLCSSLKSYDDYYSLQFHLLPRDGVHFDNYARVFTSSENFLLWISNTLFLIVTNTVLCTVSTSMVAYGFAKFRCKASNALFMVLLATMMIPWAVTMVPSYLLWARLGLTDSFYPLILPSVGGSAYYVFMFRQNMRGIPNEIMEGGNGRREFADEIIQNRSAQLHPRHRYDGAFYGNGHLGRLSRTAHLSAPSRKIQYFPWHQHASFADDAGETGYAYAACGKRFNGDTVHDYVLYGHENFCERHFAARRRERLSFTGVR